MKIKIIKEGMVDQTNVFGRGQTSSRGGTPKFIVIHYSYTRSPKTTVRVLNKRGLSTHYEVDQEGNVHKYADPGSTVTFHGGKMNNYSIGIDVTSTGTFSSEQISAARQLVTSLCRSFGIPQVVAPDGVKYTNIRQIQKAGVGILRHRNLRPTACPGKFPMDRLGEPAEEELSTQDKEKTALGLAGVFGFDKSENFMDKILGYVAGSQKIDSKQDIVGLFKNLFKKFGGQAQMAESHIYGDIELILKEDKEWWLKRRPQDKKNLRALVGDSAKGGQHVKKGTPYTEDPPKYKGNKGAPGLGLLEANEEIPDEKQKEVAEKLAAKYIPDADEDFISKVGDYFKDNPTIKTIADIAAGFGAFLGKFAGSEKTGGEEVTADQSADLGLSYKNLWRKFGGFDEYVKFLWKQFDDHRDEISSWSRNKIDSRIREVASKYDIPAYVLLGIMHGESNLKPVGIHTQTMGNAGDPEVAIRKNSSAYGMGQVVGSSYDKIKHSVGVPHYMLWNPYYGIDAVGALVKLLIKNRCKGETICYRAMRSYAGTTAGGHRKMASIAKWQKKENA